MGQPSTKNQYSKIFAKSNWRPPPNSIPIELIEFSMDIGTTLQHYQPKPIKKNLTPPELKALDTLRNSNLVVCRADKGSTTVFMTIDNYKTLCLEHLLNKDTVI